MLNKLVTPGMLQGPTPSLFEGRGVVFVITKKRGAYWGAAGARKQPYLPQYDSFMRIGDEIGELLEMLLLRRVLIVVYKGGPY